MQCSICAATAASAPAASSSGSDHTTPFQSSGPPTWRTNGAGALDAYAGCVGAGVLPHLTVEQVTDLDGVLG
ncbi:hypothetical protein SMICM304S_02838 [Streptomyces microflavus]